MFVFALVSVHVCVCASVRVLEEGAPSRRIMGRHEFADIKFFPHAAQVLVRYAHVCGSSILKPRIVITAAHCLNKVHNTRVLILHVGSSYNEDGGVTFDVQEKMTHHNYTSTFQNDIALLLTKTSMEFSINVNAAIFTKTYKSFKYAIIAGWGVTFPNSNDISMYLQYLAVPVVPLSECERVVHMPMHGKFCAGYGTWDKGTAPGDSGSGLMINRNTIVGLLLGDTYYHDNIDMYTNLTFYYQWIQNGANQLINN